MYIVAARDTPCGVHRCFAERAAMSKFLFHPRRVLGRIGFVATALGIGDPADRHAGPRLLHTAIVGEPLTPR